MSKYDFCPLDVNPHGFPNMDPEEELIKYYGQPGDLSNLTQIKVPYQLTLSWDQDAKVNKITCHKKIADSLQNVLINVLNDYGIEEIKRLRLDQFGGCYNFRTMRGGSRHSLHSWGIALDFNPIHNKLRWGSDKATFADPVYEVWWQRWEEEGWASLGRTKNYDWMHVQAAKIT